MLNICYTIRNKSEYQDKRIGIDKCFIFKDNDKLWWIRSYRELGRNAKELEKGRNIREK